MTHTSLSHSWLDSWQRSQYRLQCDRAPPSKVRVQLQNSPKTAHQGFLPKLLLNLKGQGRVPITPDDKRWRFDLVELLGRIIFHKTFECGFPVPCWNLQVLLHQGFEKRLRYRLNKKTGLKIMYKAGANRICQRGDERATAKAELQSPCFKTRGLFRLNCRISLSSYYSYKRLLWN